MEQVIIGVDPHKLSATIEVVDEHERVLGSGRFATDRAGYAAMRGYVRSWPDRVWAVEGANGSGDGWLSGCSRPASGFSTFRRSWPPGSGSWTALTRQSCRLCALVRIVDN
jgi:hypothetical protein